MKFANYLTATAVSVFSVFVGNMLPANAIILSPKSATASSEFSNRFGIRNTINQSGLSSRFNSGTDDFDTFLSTNPTHTILAGYTEWFTPTDITTATVTYNLGNVFTLDRLALWNEEFAGISKFNLLASKNGVDFSTVSNGISPINNPLNSDYPAEVIDFGSSVDAQYVKLDITDCPQPNAGFNGCGIGEVAFSASTTQQPIPFETEGTMGFLALGGYLFYCHRKKRDQSLAQDPNG